MTPLLFLETAKLSTEPAHHDETQTHLEYEDRAEPAREEQGGEADVYCVRSHPHEDGGHFDMGVFFPPDDGGTEIFLCDQEDGTEDTDAEQLRGAKRILFQDPGEPKEESEIQAVEEAVQHPVPPRKAVPLLKEELPN